MSESLINEANAGFTLAEAIAEANRCLNCAVPQCKKHCPISNDIPDWIHEFARGNFGNAMSIVNAKSNLPAVCGRVCAHERQCEGNCILGKKGAPVRIGIGSGPAGLTVAGELARRGFEVDIYEMETSAGGVLMFGIPEYRLPKAVVSREIKKITELGVRINCGVTIGQDMTIDDLFAKGYDAIFMGTGTGKPKTLPIPGAKIDAVRQAIYFLRRVSLYNSGLISREEVPVKAGDKVFVIGCGNTAIDAARTAMRLEASEVSIVYHRDIDKMKALRAEYDDAVAEGVKFLWNTSIVDIHSDNGILDAVTLDCNGERTVVSADKVILAVGSQPAARIVSTTEGIDVDENGYVLTRDEPYGMTTRKGVFAGGDVTNRPATVVHAMQDARNVAHGIEQYVDAVRIFEKINARP